MTATALHLVPSRRRVFQEQLRAVGLSLRKEAVVVLAVLVLLAVIVLIDAWRLAHTPPQPVGPNGELVGYGRNGPNLAYGPMAAIPVAVLALFLPYVVWGSSEAAPRAYLRSLPVAWFDHTMLRVATGWVWLMVAVAGYLLWIGLINLGVTVLGAPFRESSIGAWEWLVPFTAATVAYLFGSIAVVGSKRPLQWILGVLLGWLILAGAIDVSIREHHANWAARLFEGEYGLAAAMFGDVGHWVTTRITTHGHTAMWAHTVANVQRWIVSTVLWGVPASGALLLMAARKRDE